MTKRIWVLTDDRAGNNAQALGVAESTGFAVETKRVYYTKCAVLPNFLRGATTLGVARETLNEIKPPYPDFVVAAGRRAAPLARYVKKKSAGKTKIVQLMFPGKAGLVTRPNYVKARAFDENLEEYEIEGEGLLARAICHELDHLDGHMYVEKVEGEIHDVQYADPEDEEDWEEIDEEA